MQGACPLVCGGAQLLHVFPPLQPNAGQLGACTVQDAAIIHLKCPSMQKKAFDIYDTKMKLRNAFSKD
jgi:hypothetical protein